MREIKFRAWDKVNEIMLYENLNINLVLSSEQYVVEQYTGLKDKNVKGDEIYEHDIIDNAWVVRFYDGSFVLCNPINEPIEQCALEVFNALTIKNSKITGNIHQNPELMEIKQ